MSINSQLSQKDQKLIEGCIQQDKDSLDKFYRRFYNPIFQLAYRFTQNRQSSEEAIQDIMIKILRVFPAHKQNIRNLDIWVKTVAKFFLIDEYRKEKSEAQKDIKVWLKEYNSIPTKFIPPKPGKIKYTPERISYEFKKHFPGTRGENLETSIDLVYIFFTILKKIKSDPEFQKIAKSYKVLDQIKSKFNKTWGPMPEKKIGRYRFLSDKSSLTTSEKRELEKLKKQEFLIDLHTQLNISINHIQILIYPRGLEKLISKSGDLSRFPMHHVAILALFAMKFHASRMDPQKLIYSVWKKAKILTIPGSKYNDMTKAILAFLYFKMETKKRKKEQAFLFDSIDNYVSTINNIRASHYNKKLSDKQLYQELVNYIYRESFLGK